MSDLDLSRYSVVRDTAHNRTLQVFDGRVCYGGVAMDDCELRWMNLVPVLDLAGRPVVTTVGDLTARHIGKRVRIDGRTSTLVSIGRAESRNQFWVEFEDCSSWVRYPRLLVKVPGISLEHPCEVLDEEGDE